MTLPHLAPQEIRSVELNKPTRICSDAAGSGGMAGIMVSDRLDTGLPFFGASRHVAGEVLEGNSQDFHFRSSRNDSYSVRTSKRADGSQSSHSRHVQLRRRMTFSVHPLESRRQEQLRFADRMRSARNQPSRPTFWRQTASAAIRARRSASEC